MFYHFRFTPGSLRVRISSGTPAFLILIGRGLSVHENAT